MSDDAQPFSVGALDCWALSDGQFNYPSEAFFANASPEALAEASDRPEVSAGQVTTPYTCLYLETGTEQILVDAGAGPVGTHAADIFPDVDHTTTSTGHLRENLRAIGTAPSSIDTVILTHAHPDHVGGLLDEDGTLVFGSAQYVISTTEWQFWFSETAAEEAPSPMVEVARRNLGAIDERVHLIEPETEIRPGIRARAAPGHTPGHMALSITSDGDQFLHMADLVLHPLLMAHPGWVTGFDLAPEQAAQSRRRLLDRVAARGIPVLGYHFPPFPGLGHVEDRDTGWAWTPLEAAP